MAAHQAGCPGAVWRESRRTGFPCAPARLLRAEPGRGEHSRTDWSSTGGSDRPRRLGEGGPAGHHVVDDDDRPRRESAAGCVTHDERAREVLCALLVRKTHLIGHHAAVAQRRENVRGLAECAQFSRGDAGHAAHRILAAAACGRIRRGRRDQPERRCVVGSRSRRTREMAAEGPGQVESAVLLLSDDDVRHRFPVRRQSMHSGKPGGAAYGSDRRRWSSERERTHAAQSLSHRGAARVAATRAFCG